MEKYWEFRVTEGLTEEKEVTQPTEDDRILWCPDILKFQFAAIFLCLTIISAPDVTDHFCSLHSNLRIE